MCSEILGNSLWLVKGEKDMVCGLSWILHSVHGKFHLWDMTHFETFGGKKVPKNIKTVSSQVSTKIHVSLILANSICLKKINAINLIYQEWSFLWPYSTSSWKLRDILNQSCFQTITLTSPQGSPSLTRANTNDNCDSHCCCYYHQRKGFSCLIPTPVFSSSTTTLPSYIRITNGYITVKPPIWISNRLDQRPRPDRPSQPQPTSSAPARRLWPPLTSLCLATAAFLLNLLQPSWPH